MVWRSENSTYLYLQIENMFKSTEFYTKPINNITNIQADQFLTDEGESNYEYVPSLNRMNSKARKKIKTYSGMCWNNTNNYAKKRDKPAEQEASYRTILLLLIISKLLEKVLPKLLPPVISKWDFQL